MSRSLRALILLLVLMWQSVAMLGTVKVAQQVGEIEHLAVHGQDSSHHHHADHADHALHMDDDVAVQHIHADSGNNAAGLLATFLPVVSPIRSISPPETSHAFWRSPTLDGPLRPPMLNAS